MANAAERRTHEPAADEAAILAYMEQGTLVDVARLLGRRFPKAVYGLPDDDYLPIIEFHSFEENDFTRKLQFLDANGYRTVPLDDAVAWMAGAKTLPPRAIVLTMDDGRRSTWSIAFPILKRFGMCATAYVIPGYLEEGPLRPTLADVWRGAASSDRARISTTDDRQQFLRWSEAAALDKDGTIRIESHSMLHRRMFCGPRIVGFVKPDGYKHPLFDLPKFPHDRAPWTSAALEERAGSPIFESQPLLHLDQAWVCDRKLVDACVAHAHAQGSAFFDRGDWETELRNVANKIGRSGSWVSLIPEKRWELAESKRVLAERLGRADIKHFCYPNGLGSFGSITASRELGYASSSWGLLDQRVTNRRGCNPHLLSRIKHDFVVSLPGEGRQSLLQVIKMKIRRRLDGETGY
jgi:hypothetical protein